MSEAATGGAAPAAAAPTGSAAPTASAAANNTPPAPTVSTGAPGTATPPAVTAAAAAAGKWSDAFDPDTKDYVAQKGFQDPKAVIDSYRNLEKLHGVPRERLLKLPEQGSAEYDKSMGEIFEKLGKPATAEGYGLSPKDPKDPNFTNWAKETFHKMNLTTPQAQALVKEFNAFNDKMAGEIKAQHTAKVEQQVQTLQKEWGAAYNQNIAAAQRAYRQLGIPDAAIDALEQTMGFDGVMKMFNKIGSQVGEHGYISGDGSQSFGEGAILTPEQAQARIKALKADAGWGQRYVKGDVQARQEMERLHKMAFPT